MQIRLKETESALNETLEKRNQLETERIQLLDQIAELRVSLGSDKIPQSFGTRIPLKARKY